VKIFGGKSSERNNDVLDREADVPIEDRWVEAGGFRTHYLTGGQGPPLVLLHGHGESSGSWRWVLPTLARTHRVYAPDTPGAGDSTKVSVDPKEPSFYLNHLTAFLDELGLERVALVGNSHGGNVAIRLALVAPARVTSLSLVNSSGLGREINPALIALTLPGSAALAAWLSTPFGAPQWVSTLSTLSFAQPLAAPPEWFAQHYLLAQTPGHLDGMVACLRGELDLVGQREVILDELDRLTMPTLLVWGTNDMVIPSYHATAAAARLQNSQVVMIPDCGHLPQVERPDMFVAALSRFLADQGAA
jgi:pimeloyl-ACP methyl ester carboxylesterase